MIPVMTPDELDAFLRKVFPQMFQHSPDFRVDAIEPGLVRMRMETDNSHLRPGNTISGPTLFTLADLGGYLCALSHLGPKALAVTTNLSLNFMRKAEQGALVAESKILKLGKSLMVFECTITSEVSEGVIAHATGTYAIPPK